MPTRLSLPLSLCALFAACILSACGGGGSGPPAAPFTLPVVDLGTLSSTTPTRKVVSFENPLLEPANATVSVIPSPFALVDDERVLQVGPGEKAEFDVLFTPHRPGVNTTTLTIRFEGEEAADEASYTLRAYAEPVMYFLSPSTLDFGRVHVGDGLTLEASFTNRAQLSSVSLTSAEVPSSGFAIVGDPFPLTLEPGATELVELRFVPTQGGSHDGTLRIGPSDAGGPVAVPVKAYGLDVGSEVVTDYGSVTLDAAGATPLLSVSLPSDAISLYLEGTAAGTSTPNEIGLHTLTGPGGKVYENAASLGNYVWISGWDVFSTLVPNTDRLGTQLVPGGGTYTFQLRLRQGVGSTMRVRAIVERRTSGHENRGVLPLNIFLAKGIVPTASTAASDTVLQAAVARMDGILSQQGIRVGSVAYYDIADAKYDLVETASEFRELLALSSAAADVRLNLFFVDRIFGGSVLGVAATVCGPKLQGTGMSGVLSSYKGLPGASIGRIAAHEIGHFVGLDHTAEWDGTHDIIDDTLPCPASGTSTTCPTPGGGYLMHWTSVSGSTITDGQGWVIRGHPCMEPDFGAAKPSPSAALLRLQADADMLALPDGWCATCECLRAQGRRCKEAQD